MSNESKDTNSRRRFLKNSFTALAAGLLNLRPHSDAQAAHRILTIDRPATHNMLIVGQRTVFLSHLPMFSDTGFKSPHRYQVILEAAFTKTGANAEAIYFNDRKRNPRIKIYTLKPREFVLPNLTSSDTRPPISSFEAEIHRGHLEKPGEKLLLQGVNVDIKRVIHFREFDPDAVSPGQLECILFGKGNELFLAHYVARPPDFDQVLAVSVSGHSFTDEELGRGMRVIFERPNSIADRLAEGQEAVGEVREAKAAAKSIKVRFRVGSEIYFEEGELRIPAVFEQTDAEKKAKFP